MSKFIKNLKSLFVVEEEGASASTPPKVTTPKEGIEKVKPKTIIPKSTLPGQVEEKFMNVLLQALEKANLEGYDYLEFMNAIKSLEKMNMDEPTRFKSAYTLAQTMGVTPQQLEKSAHYYLDVLKKEDSKFQNALQNQTNTNIQTKKEQIKATITSIEDNKKHIATLQKEIERQEKEIQIQQKEVETAKQKVSTAHSNFIASYQVLANKIESDIQKMKTYLK